MKGDLLLGLRRALELRKTTETLKQIILNDMQAVVESGQTGFLQALIECCHKSAGLGELDFLYQLLCLRYSSVPFIAHYRHRIDQELGEGYNEQEKFDRLCWHELQFSVLPVAYVPPLVVDAQKALLEYVRARLWYIQQRRSYQLAASQNTARPGGATGYRIRVTLSADALAFFFRMLVEAGVVIASPRSQLLRFIAANFETSGIGSTVLSANSLQKKYEQIVQLTVTAVRAILMRMLKDLDHKYA